MRRFLTTLMIVLVVLLAGLSSLVLLLNPNDFRGYLEQSAQRSGYQLVLAEPLRWHVWPRLSVLTGGVTVTAPGASEPLVSAKDMRLDVQLWPLLSHRLQVSQVVIKNAVIKLTPASAAQPPADAPIAPVGDPIPPGNGSWPFHVENLYVADTVLIWQPGQNAPLTVRDLNLSFRQYAQHQGQLEVSARLNRNQQNLTLSAQGQMDTGHYPQQLQMQISQLSYQITGTNLSAQGISGEGSLHLFWQANQNKLTFSALQLSANHSHMQGEGTVLLHGHPDWQMALRFDDLDLDNLIQSDAPDRHQPSWQASRQTAPVIASLIPTNYYGLRDFNALFSLTARRLKWRELNFHDVKLQLNNQAGKLDISQLLARFSRGDISLPGSLDVRGERPVFSFSPVLNHVPVAPLLQAFDYPAPFSGNLTLQGRFSGTRLSASQFRQYWQGQGQLQLDNMQIDDLDISSLIDQSLTGYGGKSTPDNQDNRTAFSTFSAKASLQDGILTLSDIQGQSSGFRLTGESMLNLVTQQCDSHLNVQLENAGVTNNKLLSLINKNSISLQIYGSWNALDYRLHLDKSLQNSLRDEARQRLHQWMEQQKSNHQQTP